MPSFGNIQPKDNGCQREKIAVNSWSYRIAGHGWVCLFWGYRGQEAEPREAALYFAVSRKSITQSFRSSYFSIMTVCPADGMISSRLPPIDLLSDSESDMGVNLS